MNKIDICNSALARCGGEAIIALTDTSKRAVTVSKQYEITLREMLNDSPWNFAITRAELSQSGEPLFGHVASYKLPDNCVRVLELDNRIPYRVESGFIVCDTLELIKIKYIAFIDDPTKYSGSFIKALSLKLAEDISYILVQSAALQEAIAKEAERYLRKARSMNSQEGTPDPRYPEDITFGIRQ
jgi:hypothetical protein